MPKPTRITKNRLIAAIDGSAGLMTQIAQRAGCHIVTVERKLKQWPELLELIEKERDKILDLAEAKLIQKIKDGDNTMIIFYLKTKGKHRGYVERFEHAVKELPDLKLNMER